MRVFSGWVIVLFISICSLPTWAQEGWTPVGPPTITNVTVQTAGGITYFTYISSVPNCHRVAAGSSVTLYGTNLYQMINEEAWTGPCAFEFQSYHSQTNVSVLGALTPGNYQFRLSAVSDPFGPPSTFMIIQVVVPISEIPLLQAAIETNRIKIAVQGIPDVQYTIHASDMLTNWLPVFTNRGGPFTWSDAITTGPERRFYRLGIIDSTQP